MKRVFTLLLLAAVSTCRGPEVLSPEGWDPDVHRSLSRVIREAAPGSYAVFDCDNTSIIHDVSHTLMLYQIENLRFADAPAHGFMDGIGDPSVVLPACDSLTAETFGRSLAEQFGRLKALQESGVGLEEIHSSALYLDFRARFLALYRSVGENYDYGTLCLWMPALLTGMPWDEARSLVEESVRYWLDYGAPVEEEWVSPDGRFRETAEKGLVIPAHVKNLYSSLAEYGIDAYICSASLEMFVEVLACNPEWGFGLPEDRVFGIRLAEGDTVIPAYQEGYPQPYMEGKVQNINAFMAPSHGERGPVLVGGDSNGDVAMLTFSDDTRAGLIMDCGRPGAIANLSDLARATRNRGRYLLQPSRPSSN